MQDEAANVSPNTAQQCVPAGVTSPRPADGRVSQCPSSGQDRGSRQDSGASACEPCGHGLRRFPGLESQTHSRNAPAAAPREMWGQPTGFRLGPHLLPKPFYITGHLGLDGQRLRLRQRKPQRLLLQRKQLAKMSVRPGTESPARGRVGCGRRRPLLPRTGEDHTAQCGCSVRGNRDRRPPCSPCETSLFQKRPADEWTRQAPYRVHTHRLGQSWRQSSAEAQGRQHGS